MPLIDDLRDDVPEDELRRRRAFLAVGASALGVAGLGTLVTSLRFLRPNVLFEPATRFVVGRPADLPVGSVLDLPRRQLFVVRNDAGFYAMSSVCTHLGCMVKYQKEAAADGAFFCPCHGSRFDLQGEVLGGPAPRPLDRCRLELDGDQLVVDVSETVPPGTVTEA